MISTPLREKHISGLHTLRTQRHSKCFGPPKVWVTPYGPMNVLYWKLLLSVSSICNYNRTFKKPSLLGIWTLLLPRNFISRSFQAIWQILEAPNFSQSSSHQLENPLNIFFKSDGQWIFCHWRLLCTESLQGQPTLSKTSHTGKNFTVF